MLRINTILHPTDFSVPSRAALVIAHALARDYGARLILAHIKPPDIVYGEVCYSPLEPMDLRRSLEAQLAALVPIDPLVQIEHYLTDGDPATEILRAARESHCDLIVLGTHGRTGVTRLLLGSVAEAVMRGAPCPVLTVKSPVVASGTAPTMKSRETVHA